MTTSPPHDSLFKSVFQQPENAAGELQHVIAPELAAAIDWSTLTLEPGSFVDEALSNQHSDLLFSARARSSQEQVLVYLLFEHQSSAEPRMALRLLGYMVAIWKRFASSETESPLPLIIPAVLAQVPGGWNVSTRFSSLFSPNLGEAASAVLPDFTYAVDELHRADDENLRRRSLAMQARLALWLMRDARDGALLLRRLVDWVADIEALATAPGGEHALLPLLHYVARVSSDLQLEQFRAILEDRAPTAESITMTIAEQLHAEGHAKGRSQGRAEGKIEGKIEGKAEALILVLEGRGLRVDAHTRARLEAMPAEEVDVLLRRVGSVSSLDELLEP